LLLVHSDPDIREQIAGVFLAAGYATTVVSRIAEVERWPQGELVISEARFSTHFWLTVGAAHVVVLTEDDRVENHGTSVTCLPLRAGAQALRALVDSFQTVAA